MDKNVSNPISTGGGGTNFERNVGAYYLSKLLLRSVAKGGGVGRIKELRFQRLFDDEPLDDLIIIGESPTGTKKLALQIKRDLSFGEKNEIFNEVISACWETFTAETFNKDMDRFGICLNLYSKTVDEYYQPVLTWARNSASAKDFFKRIGTRNLANNSQRSFVSLIRGKINSFLSEDVTDEILWQFFKCLVILRFDFQTDGSADYTHTIESLRNALQDSSPKEADALFDKLSKYSAELNQTAGSIDSISLSQRLINDGFNLKPDTSFNLDELFIHYLEYLRGETEKVQILGDIHSHNISEVFVESSIIKNRDRPSSKTLADYQQQMDGELQKRQNPLFDYRSNDEIQPLPGKGLTKVSELLQERTRAIIVGAPGYGKSTLLRFLANQTLNQEEKLPIMLEFKTIKEKDFDLAEGLLTELIFNQTLAKRVCRTPIEREALRNEFYNRLRAGRISLFLDGLDEVSGEKFFVSLRQGVKEFIDDPRYAQTNLIITARPYAVVDQYDRNQVQELELAPFNRKQIEQFVYNYYEDEKTARKFLDKLNYRNELNELSSVPALLGFLLILSREQNEMPESRAGIYHEIVQQLVDKWDEEKAVKRDFMTTPARRLKFLFQLAFSRLFEDSGLIISRQLIFSKEEILEEAEKYCLAINQPGLADKLSEEVAMTPLLRQVGTDMYSFAHLSILEYLAAISMVKNANCQKLFAHGFFNSSLCEMEILPMILGMAGREKQLFAVLEGLPESLDYKKLRLKARSLSYGEVPDPIIEELIEVLIKMIYGDEIGYGYFELIAKSFNGIFGATSRKITSRIGEVLNDEHEIYRRYAVRILGFIGNEEALEWLNSALSDPDSYVRIETLQTIGRSDEKNAVRGLTKELETDDREIRKEVVYGLWQIGNPDAVKVLKDLVINDDDQFIRKTSLEALAALADEDEVTSLLIEKLKDEEEWVRGAAITELGERGGEKVIDGLIEAASFDEPSNAEEAIKFLGKIGGQKVYDFLIDFMERNTGKLLGVVAEALGNIGEKSAVPRLKILLDRYIENSQADQRSVGYVLDGWINDYIKVRIAYSLYQLGDSCGIGVLMDELENGYHERRYAARVLSQIKGREIVPLLLHILDKIEKNWLKNEDGIINHGLSFNFAITIGHILYELGGENLEKVTSMMADYLEKKKNSFPVTDDSVNAINLLGRIGGRKSVEAIEKAIFHADPTIQITATVALGNNDNADEKTVEVLLIRSFNGVNAVMEFAAKNLAKMDPAILTNGLFLGLKSEWRIVRERSAETVGYYSDNHEITNILSDLALNDPKESVKNIAQKAMTRFRSKQDILGDNNN